MSVTFVHVFAILLQTAVLSMGSAPDPVQFPHFPDRVHAFVWRNWPLVPTERMAEVLQTESATVLDIGRGMGLEDPPEVSEDQWRRSYITIIRRNWHLLPYEQLLQLLDWTEEEMAFTLREDDFLFIKLGSLKPRCEPLVYREPNDAALTRRAWIRSVLQKSFPHGVGRTETPLFGFVSDLSRPLESPAAVPEGPRKPRWCYSYFALYGDPLLNPELDPFPEGYLDRLAASGVNGVWLQAVLFNLAPYPWNPKLSEGYETRLENLKRLVERAKERGIGVYLYVNEPRSMPLAFFEGREELRGVVEGDYAAVCTSVESVRNHLVESVESICKAVPDLAGFFTITASENLTNCWSHHRGMDCAKCSTREPAEVIAEVNSLIQKGIDQSGASTRLIAWDWGWKDEWAEGILNRLPKKVGHMSVSEWSIPIVRGGVESVVGEYSISEVGPGPRAARHWEFAQAAGLKTFAKIQANNTWEISAVPFIPAVENVARHAANLRERDLEGIMLGWTLGGHPSPNFEVLAALNEPSRPTVDEALHQVAAKRYGEELAGPMVKAWKAYSAAFQEYPYHIGVVYNAPQQMGPANLLWEKPTGYSSTMVGLPYDSLDVWRAVYPEEVFIGQFEKMAEGFRVAHEEFSKAAAEAERTPNLQLEMDVAEVCAIHFQSVANQSRFVRLRGQLAEAGDDANRRELLAKIATVLESERDLAIRLFEIQSRESRIGFEATNHYFYIPIDLAEKVLNVAHLMEVYTE